MSRRQENKGKRGILDLMGQLSQVLKQFEGIYAAKLPETEGLTVEAWMSAHGVERFTTKAGKKKGYTPALVKAGWHDAMQTGDEMRVFGKVAAKVYIDDIGEENPISYNVYTKENAEKVARFEQADKICVYKQVAVAPNRWKGETLLKGLMQSRNFEKENNKSVESGLAWEQLEHVYIVRESKNEETKEVTRKVVEIQKTRVIF